MYQTMILCETCGNKRCPHANDKAMDCTNSNDPGQKGSAYETCPSPTTREDRLAIARRQALSIRENAEIKIKAIIDSLITSMVIEFKRIAPEKSLRIYRAGEYTVVRIDGVMYCWEDRHVDCSIAPEFRSLEFEFIDDTMRACESISQPIQFTEVRHNL